MEEHLKSKTQLKKEADDVQTLGVEIAQLPKQKITSLSLPDDAKEAIIFYQHIKKKIVLKEDKLNILEKY